MAKMLTIMHNQQIQQAILSKELLKCLQTFSENAFNMANILKTCSGATAFATPTNGQDDEVIILPENCEPVPLHPANELVPVVAVDMSTVKLAETVDGGLWAVRGCIVAKNGRKINAANVGPFVYLASPHNVEKILQSLYAALGIDARGHVFHAVTAPKLIGNLFEKILQLHASRLIDGGILLLDGSLTVGPLDSPVEAVSKIVESAKKHGLGVAAFSKSTTLTVEGKSILSLSTQAKPPYVIKLPPNRDHGWSVCKGSVYVSHLSPKYFPFRVDVSSRNNDLEIFSHLLASENIVYGYPESLILAHQFAKMSRIDSLSTRAAVETSLGIKFLNGLSVRPSLFGPLSQM